MLSTICFVFNKSANVCVCMCMCLTRSIKLFETWNKYKSRLPTSYFEKHLLKIADFLFDNKVVATFSY